MNKYVLVAALAAPSFVLVSCTKTPESLAEDAISQMDKAISLINECDKSNADSKASDIEKVFAKLQDITADMKAMEKDDPDGTKKLKENKELQEKLVKTGFELMGSLMKAKQNGYYGSAELRKVLNKNPFEK